MCFFIKSVGKCFVPKRPKSRVKSGSSHTTLRQNQAHSLNFYIALQKFPILSTKNLIRYKIALVHALTQPLPPVSLKRGVKPEEFDAYQELHQAVFEGAGINMDDHESSVYQPELDLIAVGPTGQFGAFCLCELEQVTDSQGERLVGEVGVIGTRPELQRQGLGRALLLTGLRQMRERGATDAYLETSESHVPAQRLFASVGFTHLSSWQWYAKTVEPF